MTRSTTVVGEQVELVSKDAGGRKFLDRFERRHVEGHRETTGTWYRWTHSGWERVSDKRWLKALEKHYNRLTGEHHE